MLPDEKKDQKTEKETRQEERTAKRRANVYYCPPPSLRGDKTPIHQL